MLEPFDPNPLIDTYREKIKDNPALSMDDAIGTGRGYLTLNSDYTSIGQAIVGTMEYNQVLKSGRYPRLSNETNMTFIDFFTEGDDSLLNERAIALYVGNLLAALSYLLERDFSQKHIRMHLEYITSKLDDMVLFFTPE